MLLQFPETAKNRTKLLCSKRHSLVGEIVKKPTDKSRYSFSGQCSEEMAGRVRNGGQSYKSGESRPLREDWVRGPEERWGDVDGNSRPNRNPATHSFPAPQEWPASTRS